MQRFKAVIVGNTTEETVAQAAVDAIIAVLPDGFRTVAAPWKKTLLSTGEKREVRIIITGSCLDDAAAEAAWTIIKTAIPAGFVIVAAKWEKDLSADSKAIWVAEQSAALAAKELVDKTVAEKILTAIDKNVTFDQTTKDAIVAIVNKEANIITEEEKVS